MSRESFILLSIRCDRRHSPPLPLNVSLLCSILVSEVNQGRHVIHNCAKSRHMRTCPSVLVVFIRRRVFSWRWQHTRRAESFRQTTYFDRKPSYLIIACQVLSSQCVKCGRGSTRPRPATYMNIFIVFFLVID